jgi:NAD-dependent SIR2 family protein deacetylase
MQEDFPEKVELLFIFGTSLTVFPAAGLVSTVKEDVHRMLFNREPVGEELGLEYNEAAEDATSTNTRDIWMNISCDESALLLAKELGWIPELYAFKDDMCSASKELIESAYIEYSSS